MVSSVLVDFLKGSVLLRPKKLLLLTLRNCAKCNYLFGICMTIPISPGKTDIERVKVTVIKLHKWIISKPSVLSSIILYRTKFAASVAPFDTSTPMP